MSLKLSDARVYHPQIRARLGTLFLPSILGARRLLIQGFTSLVIQASMSLSFESRLLGHRTTLSSPLCGKTANSCVQGYRGTSLIRNSTPLAPYGRTMPRALRGRGVPFSVSSGVQTGHGNNLLAYKNLLTNRQNGVWVKYGVESKVREPDFYGVFDFRVSGFDLRVSGFGFRVPGFRLRTWGFGFRVSGFGIRASVFGFRNLNFGFRVSGFGF